MPDAPPIIEWLIEKQLPQVLEIDHASFDDHWTEADYRRLLRQKNVIGMSCCESDGRVVGFYVYELHRDKIQLLRLAVAPDARRYGIGRQMVGRLFMRLSGLPGVRCQRSVLALFIRETNLAGQLFFRSCGFRSPSMGVISGHYRDGEAAYVMTRRHGSDGAAAACGTFAGSEARR
jgi:[ribosomal protein S18]-alanine N-acetyltransferase